MKPARGFVLVAILIVVALLIGIGGTLAYFKLSQTKPVPSPSLLANQPSPDSSSVAPASPAGGSAKDETANWKGANVEALHASFKYPPNWYISEFGEGGPEGGAFIVSVSNKKEGECNTADSCKSISVNRNYSTNSANNVSMLEYDYLSSLRFGQRVIYEGGKFGFGKTAYTRKQNIQVHNHEGIFVIREILAEKFDHTSQLLIMVQKEPSVYYHISGANEELIKKILSTFRFE